MLVVTTGFPISSFKTKVSYNPAEVKLTIAAPGSKSTVFEKKPVIKILFVEFANIDNPWSALVPPNCEAKTKFPEEFNLEMKISAPPFEIKFDVLVPGSKSAVPLK